MILSCQNICKSFNDKNILQNISFHIEDQEKAAIVGINGAGKTTLLRIIVGELQADEGNVVLSKNKSFLPPPREHSRGGVSPMLRCYPFSIFVTVLWLTSVYLPVIV